MSYISKYTGAEIDEKLGQVDTLSQQTADLKSDLSELYFRKGNAPFARNINGHTIISGFEVVAGHTYIIVVKSDSNIQFEEGAIGLGSNGGVRVKAEELLEGYVWEKVATASSSNSRVYISSTTGTEGINITASIYDVTMSNKADGIALTHTVEDVKNEIRQYGGIPFNYLNLFEKTENLYSSLVESVSNGYYSARSDGGIDSPMLVISASGWKGYLIKVKPNTTYTTTQVDFKFKLFDIGRRYLGEIEIDTTATKQTITMPDSVCYLSITQKADRNMSAFMIVEGTELPSEYISGQPRFIGGIEDAIEKKKLEVSSVRQVQNLSSLQMDILSQSQFVTLLHPQE